MKTSQGKLLVLDGIDGSGKTTQIKLLAKYLNHKKVPFKVISFPRYGNNRYTDQIESYLKGKKSFEPYSIAKSFAGDRLLAKPLINRWIKQNKLVIANRYTAANKAHLGVDLPEDEMPKPDLTILLAVDPKVGQKNITGTHKPDIHEGNLAHLEEAGKIYLELAKRDSNWYVVDCMADGQMRAKEDIHQEIVRTLEKLKILERNMHEK